MVTHSGYTRGNETPGRRFAEDSREKEVMKRHLPRPSSTPTPSTPNTPSAQPMTAMIDIVFLLLIFFMCVTQFRTLEGALRGFMPRDAGLAATDPADFDRALQAPPPLKRLLPWLSN